MSFSTQTKQDELQLVEKLKAFDSKAQTYLVKTYGPYLRKIALSYVKNDAAADDVLQDCLVNAIRKIDQFSGDSPLRAWLRRIVINTALMRLRSEKRKAEEFVDPTTNDFDAYGTRIEAHWPSMKNAEEILSQKHMAALVHKLIEELPEQYRIVLMLRDIEEMSTREVADMLEENEGTVKVRLHRARAALKKKMEPILRGEIS